MFRSVLAQSRPRSRRTGDEGSATIVAVTMVAVLVTVAAGGAQIGAAVIARHRAQSAADLAALAAAARLPAGAGYACAWADRLATHMATALVACAAEDLDVVVTVQASTGMRASWLGPATAIARAGPQIS